MLDKTKDWKGIKSIIQITSKCIIKKTQKESVEQRYYITFLGADADKINKAIRIHWSIENNLRWNLDVVFKGRCIIKEERRFSY